MARAVGLHLPVAHERAALDFRDGLVRGQRDDEARDAALHDLVAQVGGVFDDGGREVRARLGVHGDEGFARDLDGLALPAQRERAVRAEETADGADGARGLAGFVQRGRAGGELQINAGDGGLRGDAAERGGGAGEGDLVPRFLPRDFREEVELKFVHAGRGRDEAELPRAVHDAQTRGQRGREHGDVSAEERRGNFIRREGLDAQIHAEARLGLGDFPGVTNLVKKEVRRNRRGFGDDGDGQFRRAGAARENLQAVQHRHAVRAGRDLEPHGHAREHGHVAEHNELLALLHRAGGAPTGGAEDGLRAENVGAAEDGEDAVLLAGDIGVRVAVEEEMVMAGIEIADGDGEVAAVEREDVAVVHGVARGVAPHAGGVRDGEGDFRLGAVGEF